MEVLTGADCGGAARGPAPWSPAPHPSASRRPPAAQPHWAPTGCSEGHVGGSAGPQIPPRITGVPRGEVGPTMKVFCVEIGEREVINVGVGGLPNRPRQIEAQRLFVCGAKSPLC